ncbi:MAG: TRAP transporter small permease [bacterium]
MVKTALRLIHVAEEALLALLLTAMIVLSASQVVLRNFFDSGLYWGDSAVRVVVLWVAMLGAMIASRRNEHIRIDIASRFVSPAFKPHMSRFVSAFTCLVLLVFAWYSIEFVRYEYEDGTIAFGIVPAWLCEIIMPIGAGVMALRYAILTVVPDKGEAPQPVEFSAEDQR